MRRGDRATWWRFCGRHLGGVAAAFMLLSAAPGLAQGEDDVDDGSAPKAAPAEAEVSVAKLITRGNASLKAKEYEQAAELFRQALAKAPGNVNAHKGLGRALERQRRWAEAAEVYQKSIKAAPQWKRALYRLGFVYRKLGQYDEAVKYYGQYIDEKPDDPDGYYGLGQAHVKGGNNAQAVSTLKRYVEKETRPSEKKYVARAKELIASLEAEPDLMAGSGDDGAETPKGDPVALMASGDRAFAEQNMGEAARYYRGAARQMSEGVEAHYKLGVVLAIRGDLPGAISAWEVVLSRDPSMTAASDNIARARRKLQMQADKGIDDPRLEQDLDAQLELAQGYLQTQRHAMALRVLDPLINEHPTDGRVRVMRGRSLMALGRYEEARRDLELALAATPGEPDVLLALGRAYQVLDKGAQAAYFLRRYLERVDPAGRDSSLAELRATVEALEAVGAKP